MTEQKELENYLKPEETTRILKNVGVISVTFMVYFTAYCGTTNLQSSIHAEAGLGTASLAALFCGALLSNIFLTSVVMKWLGAKWAICSALTAYLPYIASQLYPTFYTMVPAGFLLGLGAGPLWCSKGTYLSTIAKAHSSLTKIPAETLLLRFFGFFFMIFQMGQIWGNLISSLVISMNNKAAVTSVNKTMIPKLCGANFLPFKDAHEALPTQPPEKIQILTGIFFACVLGAVFIVAVGLDSMKRYDSCRKNAGSSLSGLALLAVTSKNLADRNQVLLIPITIFIGLNQAFFGADFNASFVSCAIGTGSVGYTTMTYGLSLVLGSYITSYVAKLFGRLSQMISAFFIHGGIFIAILLWRPHAEDYYIMIIIAVLWGTCEAIWVVQLNAYYGYLFRGKEEAGFSNLRLWEAVGCIISYVLSSYVRTRYKIYVLLCVLRVVYITSVTIKIKSKKIER
ncbi:unnamed protein product [Arctia plantaginis]|uniref:UNC93-like protein n=1 Tax=Arctia plantaginis TaxID=874455 RepID=A0A8S1BS63_ARCPL|nr:unnamed protein product [Arctia plantaginis]